MTERRISEFGPEELSRLAASESLDELTALKILRNPYCNSEIAEKIADKKRVLASHSVRQLLCGIRGFSFPLAMNFLATLPWLSLLELVASPRTPPLVRRQAERKLLLLLPNLARGEKIALARRSPRPFFRSLIESNDEMVLTALLNNGRLVENDVLLMLNTAKVGGDFCREVASHQRWGQYLGVRRALVTCPATPLTVALSLAVLMRDMELERLVSRPDLPDTLKTSIKNLLEKRKSQEND